MISQKLKDTLRGVLIATATWMIVLPLSQKITELTPVKDTMTAGIILLGILIFWDGW